MLHMLFLALALSSFIQGPSLSVQTFENLPEATPLWVVNYLPASYQDDGTPIYPQVPQFSQAYFLHNVQVTDDGTRIESPPAGTANYWELWDDTGNAVFGILPCNTDDTSQPMTDCAHGDQMITLYTAIDTISGQSTPAVQQTTASTSKKKHGR